MMCSIVFHRFPKLMPTHPYFIPIFISLMVLSPEVWSQEAMDQNLQEQRLLFLKAEKELITGAGKRFYALREQLGDYPLLADLDYQVQMKALKNMTATEARLFVLELGGTPLAGGETPWTLDVLPTSCGGRSCAVAPVRCSCVGSPSAPGLAPVGGKGATRSEVLAVTGALPPFSSCATPSRDPI